MARFLQTVLMVVVVAACTAELQRFRNVRTNRFFARQEGAANEAPAAPAPYPPAGIKPDVSFELPTEATTVQPDNTYLPPANTYGPPEPEAPVEPEVATEVPEIVLIDDDDTESVISVAVSYDQDNLITPEEPHRLVFGQRTPTRPLQRLRAAGAQPIFFDDGSFAYARQF